MSKARQTTLGLQLAHEPVLSNTCWLYYCCCCGQGFGRLADPVCSVKQFCCCLSFVSECTPYQFCSGQDGCCSETWSLCCILKHGQFPPMAGAPKCALLGLKCCSDIAVYEDSLYDYNKVFNETCWLFYLCCFGVGLTMPRSSTKHCFAYVHKTLILRQTCRTETCCKDGVCCEGTGSVCCCWSETSLPPHKGHPGLALCGKRWRKSPSAAKEVSGGSTESEAASKPPQQEMLPVADI